jgi:hypothetical protein
MAFSSAAFLTAKSATGRPTTSRSMWLTFIMESAPLSSAMYSGVSVYSSCSCLARKVSAARLTSGPTS